MTDYNAGNRADVKQAQRSAKAAELAARDVLLSLMSSPNGRSWVLDRLERCHIFSSSYTSDSHATAFAEGERNIGLRDLVDIMAVCPDLYVTMMQERNAREVTEDVRRAQRSAAASELTASEEPGRDDQIGTDGS